MMMASRILLYAYILSVCCIVSRLVLCVYGEYYENDDEISDWLDENEDDRSFFHYDDVSAGGKMTKFFEKLNSLRQKHRKYRLKSNHPQSIESERDRTPFINKPVAKDTNDQVVQDPLHYADNDRKSYWKESNQETSADDDYTMELVGNRDGLEVQESRSVATEGTEETITAAMGSSQTTRTPYVHRTNEPQEQPRATYLHMGRHSAWCLWRQYLRAETEPESQLVRERFRRFVRFWTAVIGVSVALLWSVFGFFHGLFCVCITAPPVAYAKDVNKYLTMVPPHVVVTDKGKVFRYRPTAEERFLWKSAKRISKFKI